MQYRRAWNICDRSCFTSPLTEALVLQLARERPSPPMPPKPSLPTAGPLPKEAAKIALTRAIRFYSTLQTHDGHFAGDYGGPMFLMPGLVRSLSSTAF